MSDEPASNDCPICLHPFASEKWGVCVPCGHPLHLQCGKDLSSRANAGDMSCPICSTKVQSFIQVYLDINDFNTPTTHAKNSWLSQLQALLRIRAEQNHSIQHQNDESLLSTRYKDQSIDYAMHESITTALFALIMVIGIVMWLPMRLLLHIIMGHPYAEDIIATIFCLAIPLIYIFAVSCLNVLKRKKMEADEVKRKLRDITILFWNWELFYFTLSVLFYSSTLWLSSNKAVSLLLECTSLLFYFYIFTCMMRYLGSKAGLKCQ